MDTKNICRLCLVSKNKIIEFFSDEGMALNITTILDQHFWFQVHRDDNLPIGICRMCWKCVNDFHDFYKNVESLHKNHYDNIQFKNELAISNIKSEIADSNNDALSFIQSNIELAEQIVEIKIEHENTGSNGKIRKQIGVRNIFNTTTNNKRTKMNNTKKTIKKIITKELKKDTVKMGHAAKKKIEPQLSIEECSTIVNDNINKNESNDLILTNANIFEDNDFIENQDEYKKLDEKLDNNQIRAAEDIQIKEFYNLICEMCSSQHYPTLLELKKHYREAHNCKNGYVSCCNKKLTKRCDLLEHIFWHTNPDEFKCNVCNKIYVNKLALKIHMHFHSKPEERKYICDICGTNFTLKYHLTRHFHKNHRTQVDSTFYCNRCEKSFKKKVSLQRHIQAVHEFKYVNICQICAKVYKSKQQYEIHYLEQHTNVNLDKPKLKCNLCGAMSKNETSLKRHMRRTHFSEPSECKLCGKITPNKNALQDHMRYVHVERTHKCNLCDKAFKKPIELKQHTATHSGNSILYSCAYCTTTFNSKSNMHSHRKKKHPVEWLADRQRRLGITTINNYYN